MTNSKNEATFEARLNSAIERIFPNIEIGHQKIIKFKFGHHNIEIDAHERELVTGRLDVLLEYAGKPLAILELKKPHAELTDSDRQQGLSYAKILDPQAPLVIVTNGADLQIYQTIDGKKLDDSTFNESLIKQRFQEAAIIASASRDEAIKALLGQHNDILKKLFHRFTRTQLIELTGPIDDISYPIAENFLIPRKAADIIINDISAGHKLISLSGPPLCGKTNILQLASESMMHNESYLPIYLNANSIQHGILTTLSTIFATTVFSTMTNDDVRKWLLTHFSDSKNSKLVILLDSWSSTTSARLLGDLSQLLQILPNANMALVVAMDSVTNELLSQEENRPTKTQFGRMKKDIFVDYLDVDELNNALDVLAQKFRVTFYPGIKHNFEYRTVRYFRVWAAAFQNKFESSSEDSERVKMSVLSPITNMRFLKVILKHFVPTPGFKKSLMSLAIAYMEDDHIRKLNHEVALLSHGRIYIQPETAKKYLSEQELQKLIETGHVRYVDGPQNKVFLMPTMPELVAAAGAYVIADQVSKFFTTGDFDQAYSFVLKSSISFPISEVVAALAIVEATKQKRQHFEEIIVRLVNDEPTTDQLKSDSSVLMDFEGELIKLSGEGLAETTVLSNTHPWLVLSQLIVSELGVLPDLLGVVGSCQHLLRRLEAGPFLDRPPFHSHNFPDGTEILCPSSSEVVEPITAALLHCLDGYPEEIKSIAKKASRSNNIALAARLQVVANLGESNVKPEVVLAAQEISLIVKNTFKDFFEKLHGHT